MMIRFISDKLTGFCIVYESVKYSKLVSNGIIEDPYLETAAQNDF
jgi:hypothetical protein